MQFFEWFFDIEDHPDESLIHQTARTIAGFLYMVTILVVMFAGTVGVALLLRTI